MKCTAKLVALSLETPYPRILKTVSVWAVDLPSYKCANGMEGFYTWPLLALKGWVRGALDTSAAFLGDEIQGTEIVFENDEEVLTFMFLRDDFAAFIDRLEKDGRLLGHNWDLDEMHDYVTSELDDRGPKSYSFGVEHLN